MADLITVTQFKDSEGIRGEKDDDRLNVIVPQVSDLVKKYCGTSFIDFYSSAKTETFTVYDKFTSVIILSESPVNSVSSVQERTSYSGDYTTLTTGAYEYYFDAEADAVYRTTKNGEITYWPKGVGAVKISYTAGYSATPEALKLALFDLVNYYLKDEHKERRSIAGASIQNQASSSQRNNVAFPDHIKRVLDLYKNF